MKVLLAQPRGFCAGVVRAISTVETALRKAEGPVYVRHEIVHNRHVVDTLESKGARFVEELSDMPDGAVAIFSAHGVPRSVEVEAGRRALTVHDATCPLVTKVHNECRRYVEMGRALVLVGHAGHPEVVGTTGQVAAPVHLVESEDDVRRLPMADDTPIAFVTQTTLSVDDTKSIVGALKLRFPDTIGPDTRDICYATQNRQSAVRDLCKVADVVIVVGARNSSNSNRLHEICSGLGVRSYLVASSNDLRAEWFNADNTIGLTAGASAPEQLVQGVVDWLGCRWPVEVTSMEGRRESIEFRLPPELQDL